MTIYMSELQRPRAGGRADTVRFRRPIEPGVLDVVNDANDRAHSLLLRECACRRILAGPEGHRHRLIDNDDVGAP